MQKFYEFIKETDSDKLIIIGLVVIIVVGFICTSFQ